MAQKWLHNKSTLKYKFKNANTNKRDTIFHPYCGSSLWWGRRKRTHTHRKKRKKEREREKEKKQMTRKQASIKIKLELSQWLLQLLPSPFQYVCRITFTPLSQLTQHFWNTVGLAWPVCSVRCTEKPQNCSPCLETSVNHLSLCCVGLKESKVHHWTAEQHCIKLSHKQWWVCWKLPC